jgi:D-beta-D-heptose 7-phosphate kinase/D-beta-D-heptose 1-phosphate adenosyltransferase
MQISEERLDQLFGSLERGRVLVYGDLMLDQYLWGRVDRISPEAPVPVVEVESETVNLGGAANVARNIAALGCQVDVVGIVGDDERGRRLRRLLEQEGIVGQELLTDFNRPTTLKTRIIANQQQVVRADRESRVEIETELQERVVSYVKARIDSIDCLLISDYGKGAIAAPLLKRLVSLMREHSKFVAVDPKETHFRNYRRVSVITPNNAEASFVAGTRIVDDDTLMRVGWKLLDELERDSILITLGPQGMALFEKDRSFHHLPTVAKRVYDVTGAGDTVIAAFCAFVAAGATRLEAACVANQAAGLVVEHLGTAVVDAFTLRRAMSASVNQEK